MKGQDVMAQDAKVPKAVCLLVQEQAQDETRVVQSLKVPVVVQSNLKASRITPKAQVQVNQGQENSVVHVVAMAEILVVVESRVVAEAKANSFGNGVKLGCA